MRSQCQMELLFMGRSIHLFDQKVTAQIVSWMMINKEACVGVLGLCFSQTEIRGFMLHFGYTLQISVLLRILDLQSLILASQTFSLAPVGLTVAPVASAPAPSFPSGL